MANNSRQRCIVGFKVHSAKDVSENGEAIDPVCYISCQGFTSKTEVKKGKKGSVKFEHGDIFSNIFLSEHEFNQAYIEFDLAEARTWLQNVSVGSARVQLAMVRKRKGHQYSRKWLQLQNAAQLGPKLEVTVFCYGEGDAAPLPNDEDPDIDSSIILEKPTCYHLYVHVHRAENLKGDEEKLNPYVSVEFNGHRHEFPCSRDTNALSFDEVARLPATMPLFSDAITIRVWNKVKYGLDDLLINGRISFAKVRMHALQPKWFNFYGFSQKEEGDNVLEFFGAPPEGNFYIGRLLVSARVQKVASITKLLRAGTENGHTFEEPPSTMVHFYFDVLEISGCPGKQAKVELAVGSIKYSSKEVRRKLDSSEIDDVDFTKAGRFKYKPGEGRVERLSALMPVDKADQLDIVLSIWAKLEQGSLASSGGKLQRVGYAKIKPANVQEWAGNTPSPVWVPCKQMAHLPANIEPGSVLLSMCKSIVPVKDRGMPNVKPLAFVLRVYVCMARNLMSASSEVPTSVCVVSCAGSSRETRVCPKTTAPEWKECVELTLELYCSQETKRVQPEPIQLTVYDEIGDLSVTGAVLGGKIGELGAMVGDKLAGLTGDIQANKRMGAVVGGRRIIGRAQIQPTTIVRADNAGNTFKPQWIKVKGGSLGTTHVGDILVGYELFKKKYLHATVRGVMPLEKPKRVEPQEQPCSLFISLLGLRDVMPMHGKPVEKPVLEITVPAWSKDIKTVPIAWSQKPPKEKAVDNDDKNRKWTVKQQKGFELLQPVHIEVLLPRFAVWEPSVKFVLREGASKDKSDCDILAEGRVSLAADIPWIKPKDSAKAVAALDDAEVEHRFEGIEVSDAEDDARPYPEFTIRNRTQYKDVTFNGQDNTSFPPTVTRIEPGSDAAKNGVKPGDWLVALKLSTSDAWTETATWPSSKVVFDLSIKEKEHKNDLHLRFRARNPSDITVTVKKDMEAGLDFDKDNQVKPPKIAKDRTETKMWMRANVVRGFFIIDINGTNTRAMHSADTEFQRLLARGRPRVVTCSMHGPAGEKKKANDEGVEDVDIQLNVGLSNSVVLTNGVPGQLYKETKHMKSHKDGCLATTITPRPSCYLPDVTNPYRLNVCIARSSCMDVRGKVQNILEADTGDDVDGTRTRPAMPGPLENYLEKPTFMSVPLLNGPQIAGRLKVRYKIVHPPLSVLQSQQEKAIASGKHSGSIPTQLPQILTLFDKKTFPDTEKMYYNEQALRHKYKMQQPQILRVRTYVVRGLNVSGVHSGFGNPYLYFKFGQEQKMLTGSKRVGEANPRFYLTDEQDVMLPQQSTFEFGLYDGQGQEEDFGGLRNDELIGRSVIDLEDRFDSANFNHYMKINKVPIEYRPLLQDTDSGGTLCKGSLEMWVEILDAATAAERPVNPLVQPPAIEIELRVVVWSVRNLSLRLCTNETTGLEEEDINFRVRCQIDSNAYKGPESGKSQETDTHFKSKGEGEFNWRFVFSRIAVTPGVSVDCSLHFSIWKVSHEGVVSGTTKKMLCENVTETKSYCKLAATRSELVEVPHEIALNNSELTKLLEKEAAGEDEEEGGAAFADDDDSGDSEDDEEGLDQSSKVIPPAALMKVLLQVVPQSQASNSEHKVGLGREEPNRNPVLFYPKSGRGFRDVFKETAALIDGVMEGFADGKRRCKILSVVFLVVGVIALLHYIKSEDCPIIQKSCSKSTSCDGCSRCYHEDSKQQGKLCYYAIFGGENSCFKSETMRKDYCNMADIQTSCVVEEPPLFTEATHCRSTRRGKDPPAHEPAG